MTLRELCALFIVYSHNFHVLHWKVIGPRFDEMHEIADKYYNMVFDDVDVIAELGLRLDINPPAFDEIIPTLQEAEGEYYVVGPSDRNFEYDEFVNNTSKLLHDIYDAIIKALAVEEIQDPYNVGIKATLESMAAKYDLEYRFLNKRRAAIK